MNDHEIQRIAAAICAARPDWPASSIATLIRGKLADRPRRDVFVALAWVASEAASVTPARVLEAGPWWKAAAADATFTHGHQQNAKVYGSDEGDPREVCSECGMHRHECERRAATNGHMFVSRLTAATTSHQHDEECAGFCRRVGIEPTDNLSTRCDMRHGEQNVPNEQERGGGVMTPEERLLAAIFGQPCSGAGDCAAPIHHHGCFADLDGTACDDPADHTPRAEQGGES